MIKFLLAARKKPQDTQERYFYEWGIIHVALMLTTPAVMKTFRRYSFPEKFCTTSSSAKMGQNFSGHLYVQNTHLPLDPARLKGTLFEKGGVGQFSGIEEFWFNSLEDLLKLRQDPAIYNAISASEANFIESNGSFSMVTVERVIYDFTLPESKRSPLPAVLNPESLEASIYRHGLKDWNQVAQ